MILNKQKNIKIFAKNYFLNLIDVINSLDINKIEKLSKCLEIRRKNNKNIFVIGNGGSAVNASAMANDLGFDILKKTKKKPFKIISLTDNNAINSAISNDIGFENLFTSQIQSQYETGDMLLVLSVSGNSKNLIKASQWFKKNKGYVFGILGFDGGKLKKICNDYLVVKSKQGEYGPVEDLQLIINHILAHWYQVILK
jgi:D-sedoheptulose 7-phosphate isomerase